MRLPLIAPDQLTPERQPVYEERNPWRHEPEFGQPIGALARTLSISSSLPRTVREVAILVTGAGFHSAYELCAQVLGAEARGLSDETLAAIVAGRRPSDLGYAEAVAYNVAHALVNRGALPELNYRLAVKAFGEHGAAELIYLVGLYCLVSATLNGFFGAPVPTAG